MPSTSKQALDQNLFFVGGLITLILTISAILNLTNSNNYLTIALFLPIPVYFLYLSLFKLKNALETIINLDQKPERYFGKFSFKEFVSQADWGFLVTMILFSVAVALILFKISLQILK